MPSEQARLWVSLALSCGISNSSQAAMSRIMSGQKTANVIICRNTFVKVVRAWNHGTSDRYEGSSERRVAPSWLGESLTEMRDRSLTASARCKWDWSKTSNQRLLCCLRGSEMPRGSAVFTGFIPRPCWKCLANQSCQQVSFPLF